MLIMVTKVIEPIEKRMTLVSSRGKGSIKNGFTMQRVPVDYLYIHSNGVTGTYLCMYICLVRLWICFQTFKRLPSTS